MDWTPEVRDPGDMGERDYSTILFRIDPEQNMQQFYTLCVQPNLFGGHFLVRNWGRIGTQEVKAGQICSKMLGPHSQSEIG